MTDLHQTWCHPKTKIMLVTRWIKQVTSCTEIYIPIPWPYGHYVTLYSVCQDLWMNKLQMFLDFQTGTFNILYLYTGNDLRPIHHTKLWTYWTQILIIMLATSLSIFYHSYKICNYLQNKKKIDQFLINDNVI